MKFLKKCIYCSCFLLQLLFISFYTFLFPLLNPVLSNRQLFNLIWNPVVPQLHSSFYASVVWTVEFHSFILTQTSDICFLIKIEVVLTQESEPFLLQRFLKMIQGLTYICPHDELNKSRCSGFWKQCSYAHSR